MKWIVGPFVGNGSSAIPKTWRSVAVAPDTPGTHVFVFLLELTPGRSPALTVFVGGNAALTKVEGPATDGEEKALKWAEAVRNGLCDKLFERWEKL